MRPCTPVISTSPRITSGSSPTPDLKRCDFKFSFVFGVLQAVRACRSIKLQRLMSQTQRDILYKSWDSSIKTRPHKSTSLCGKICITPPKCLRKERRRNFYSRCSIVAAAACRGNAVFPNMVRGVTFPSHAWGIWPITMHWIAGQSE